MGSRLAIGYLRVSTTGQAEDGVSIDQQEAQVRAYCVLKGLADPEIIVDLGMSGTTDRRPGFQRLISLCKNGVVGTVIVFDSVYAVPCVGDFLPLFCDFKNVFECAFFFVCLDVNDWVA